jgi:hypothetical protein
MSSPQERSRKGEDEKAGSEHERLAADLAKNVGKTVEAVAKLGFAVLENLSLRAMELFSSAKPAAHSRPRRAVASALSRARERVPELSGRAATTLTGVIVKTGFSALNAAQNLTRNTRPPR